METELITQDPAFMSFGTTALQKAVTTPWATIEEHVRKYDDTSVKKYENDLDTLLVFAGLYSSVLTGFIIEFYKSLQADKTQITVDLLSRISGQLSNDPSTAASLDPSKVPFSPEPTSTVVNMLWFLSLFMSLSAALFAMMAKKWLREYLSWSSLSADPSEVVVLRQLRGQAWEKWQAPFVLGVIPVLLELAVMLFLGGLIALLRTLDPLIFIVLTVFASLFLAIVFLLTVLPTFRIDCPYKSPVGWACVWVWNKIMQVLPPGREDGRWKVYRKAHLSATTWVRRDLCQVTGVPRYASNVAPDQKAEFAAGVLVPMVHALSWVKEDSEQTLVLHSVDSCLKTIHETADRLISPNRGPHRTPSEVILHRLNSTVFATCKLLDLDPIEVRRALRATYAFLTPQEVGISGYDATKEALYRTSNPSHDDLLALIARVIHHSRRRASEEEVRIAHRILVSAMNYAISHMFPRNRLGPDVLAASPSHPTDAAAAVPWQQTSRPVTPSLHIITDPAVISPSHSHSTSASPSPSVPASQPTRSAAPALSPACYQAFIEAFCLIEAIVTVLPPDHHSQRSDDFIQSTTKIYGILYENSELDKQYLGLRTVVFRTLCNLGNPEQVLVGLLTDSMIPGRVLDHGRRPKEVASPANRYAIAAVRLYRDRDEYCERPENRHLFAIAADMAFQNCESMPNMDLMVELLQIACEAAELCQTNKWSNCGCYHELPWLATLIRTVQQSNITHFPYFHLLQLLNALSENEKVGLLPGAELKKDLTLLMGFCQARGGSRDHPFLESPRLSPKNDTDTSPSLKVDISATIKRIHEVYGSPPLQYPTTPVPKQAPRMQHTSSAGNLHIAKSVPRPPLRRANTWSSVATVEFTAVGAKFFQHHDELLPSMDQPTEGATTGVELTLQPPTPTSERAEEGIQPVQTVSSTKNGRGMRRGKRDGSMLLSPTPQPGPSRHSAGARHAAHQSVVSGSPLRAGPQNTEMTSSPVRPHIASSGAPSLALPVEVTAVSATSVALTEQPETASQGRGPQDLPSLGLPRSCSPNSPPEPPLSPSVPNAASPSKGKARHRRQSRTANT